MGSHGKQVIYRWPGKSGQSYTYKICKLPPDFKALPGNYIFVKKIGVTRWDPLYIGQSTDLSAPLDHHHAMPCRAFRSIWLPTFMPTRTSGAWRIGRLRSTT